MCPNCKKRAKCGCKSCVERNGFDEETTTFDDENDLIIYPFCNEGSSPDAWMDAEFEAMKKEASGINS